MKRFKITIITILLIFITCMNVNATRQLTNQEKELSIQLMGQLNQAFMNNFNQLENSQKYSKYIKENNIIKDVFEPMTKPLIKQLITSEITKEKFSMKITIIVMTIEEQLTGKTIPNLDFLRHLPEMSD